MNIDTLQLVWGGNTRRVCRLVMGCLVEVALIIIIAVSSHFLLKPHMHNDIIPAHYQIRTHQIPETHRVFLHHLLVVCHRSEPNDGDDRVQHKREEEVFVQRDPLAAQTPTGGGKDIAMTRWSRSMQRLIIRSGWLTWSGKIFQGRWRGMWVTARVRWELNTGDSWQSGGKTGRKFSLSWILRIMS